MTKLSAKERAEKSKFKKVALIGAGVVAALVVGTFAMVGSASLPTLDGEKTLGERIGEANLGMARVRIAGDSGQPDVVIVGSSDCHYCRSFVEEGLDDFVAEAERLDLIVDYFPLATGQNSLASSRALMSVVKAGDAVSAIKGSYALSTGVDTADETAVLDATYELADDLGVSRSDVDFVWQARGYDEVAGISQNIVNSFQLQGTPSFYVASENDPSVVRFFTGFSSSDATIRQLNELRSQ